MTRRPIIAFLVIVTAGTWSGAAAAATPDRVKSGCRVVTYTPSTRDVAHEGDLCVPAENPTGTAVVLVHGGGAVSSTELAESRRRNLRAWADFYAEHGVLTLNIDFTQAAPPGPVYPAPITDEKNAVQYLRKRAKDLGIDPHHVVVQGHSGGARMGGNVLVTPDDAYFAALGEWPRVSDRADGFIGFYGGYRGQIGDAQGYEVFYGGQRGSTDPAVAERLARADSIAQAAGATGPALLVHGDADDIPLVASQSFATALENAGHEAEVVVVPGAGHGFDIDHTTGELTPAGLEQARRCLAWLEEHFGASS